MTSNYQSLDIFLNNAKSASAMLKDDDEGFNFGLESDPTGSWLLDDNNDNFLESIRYGTSSPDTFIQDHLIMNDNDNSDDNSTNSSLEQLIAEDDISPSYTGGECTPTATDEFEELEEEYVLSPNSSSRGSSVSGESGATFDNRNIKVVQVVGILPAGCKTIQLIQRGEDSPPTHSYLEQQQDTEMDSSSSTDSYTKTSAPLRLSEEEKRLLTKEGITLPSHYPLTKYEERELKRIRRKIRNKISAQDSRKRKKEYLDKLQARVTEIEEEKSGLVKRVRILEAANGKLSAQVKRLQQALQNAARSAANGRNTNEQAPHHVVPTATTLLVLILSLALVVLPSTMNGNNGAKGSSQALTNFGQGVSNRFGFGLGNGSLGGIRSRTMTTPAQAMSSVPAIKQIQDWDDDEPHVKIPRFSFAQNQAINNGGGVSGGKYIASMGGEKMNGDFEVKKREATFQFLDDIE